MSEGQASTKVVVTGSVAACAAVLAAAAAFIAPWEGRELKPYRDIVGVWTVCYGHTGNVQAREYSVADCDKLLQSDVAKHLAGLDKCVKPDLTQGQWVALGSWTFNVGVGAACGSTLVRQINAGYPATTWCKQLLRWDRAGGKQVRGLTNRRKAELRECLK